MYATRSLRIASALVLAIFLVISTTPISAADFASRNIALGSVSGAGNIQLRGLLVNQEGTLFPGDDVHAGAKSYAKLILANGNKIELFSDTKCVVDRSSQDIRVTLKGGNLGFAASKNPLAVSIAGYEVLPEAGATGGVAFLGGDFAGIRVMTGSVVVRNTTNKKNVRVPAGDVQIINLKTAEMNVPLAQLASAAPTSLPSAPPAPQGQAAGWWTPLHIALVIGAIGATTGITYAAVHESSPSKP